MLSRDEGMSPKQVSRFLKSNVGRYIMISYLFHTGYGPNSYTEEKHISGKLIEFDADDLVVTCVDERGVQTMSSLSGKIISNVQVIADRVEKGTEHLQTIINNNNIFISHGRNEIVLASVERFVRDRLSLTPIILKHMPDEGLTIVEKLEKYAPLCCFGLVLMTADDSVEGNFRARQNVIHEIGFLQGVYGRSRVNLLRQDDTELFTNISGIVYKSFPGDRVELTFEGLRLEMEALRII